MTSSAVGPTCRVHVRGVMSRRAAAGLPGWEVVHGAGTTVLVGPLTAARPLVPLLARLQALGLEVVQVEAPGDGPGT